MFAAAGLSGTRHGRAVAVGTVAAAAAVLAAAGRRGLEFDRCEFRVRRGRGAVYSATMGWRAGW